MNDRPVFLPLKITFHLDGTGLHYNLWEPIHLDALLAWVRLPYHKGNVGLERSDKPMRIPLPLALWEICGSRGFCASALFPEGETLETILMWRKKFRTERAAAVASGSPNIQNGPYREYNTPLPLLLCHTMTAWAVGDRAKIKGALKHIRFLGKKSSMGVGRVLGIEVEHTDADYSMVKEGRAMRWLPMPGAARLVRTQPPYWNLYDRVECCEVLDPYSLVGSV
jgi:hypothetical protein